MNKFSILFVYLFLYSNILNANNNETNFNKELDAIDNSIIVDLEEKYNYLDCNWSGKSEHINDNEIRAFHFDIFKNLENNVQDKDVCRIMWDQNLPIDKKKEYCEKKTIYELDNYQKIYTIKNKSPFIDTNRNALKVSLDIVKTNIIKKMKKLKNEEKLIGSMAYLELLISEIIDNVPSYKVSSLNNLIITRDIFRQVFNIPINASADHAANYYRIYSKNSFFNIYRKKDRELYSCNYRESISHRARFVDDLSLKKFLYYMALQNDFLDNENIYTKLNESDNKNLNKEVDILDKSLNNFEDKINSDLVANVNQLKDNLQNLSNNSKEVFLAFDYNWDWGPTIDLGNGKGLNLVTGKVGSYKKLGQ